MEHAALYVRYYHPGVIIHPRLYFRVGRARAGVCGTDHVECLVVPPRCDLPVERYAGQYGILITPDLPRAVFLCMDQPVAAAQKACA